MANVMQIMPTVCGSGFVARIMMLTSAGKVVPRPIPSFTLPICLGGNLPIFPQKLAWKTALILLY